MSPYFLIICIIFPFFSSFMSFMSLGGGPNWQQMEVTFTADDEEPRRVISLSDSSASEEKDPVDLFDSLNNEGKRETYTVIVNYFS